MKIDMPGATAPLGFFDPLGFTKGANAATLTKYRESELKHGRIAMLAVFGILTAEEFHPLYDGKLSGNPHDAWANVPQLAKIQIFLFCGFLEFVLNQVKKNENYKVLHSLHSLCTQNNSFQLQAGDFFGIGARAFNANDESWVDFQNRELNNGRLAMFAIIAILVHSQINGQGPLQAYLDNGGVPPGTFI